MACGYCGMGGRAVPGAGAFTNNANAFNNGIGRCSRCGRIHANGPFGPGAAVAGFNGMAGRGGAPFRRDCAGMNRCSTRGTDAAAEAAALEAQARNEQRINDLVARQAGGCISPLTGTVSEELYAGQARVDVVPVTCCDPCCGCREYNLADRNPFWPMFAHPRWLSCDELYSRRR